jgi:hypothetical protein
MKRHQRRETIQVKLSGSVSGSIVVSLPFRKIACRLRTR